MAFMIGTVVMILSGLLLISQIIVPPFIGMPFFWLFRPEKKRRKRRKRD